MRSPPTSRAETRFIAMAAESAGSAAASARRRRPRRSWMTSCARRARGRSTGRRRRCSSSWTSTWSITRRAGEQGVAELPPGQGDGGARRRRDRRARRARHLSLAGQAAQEGPTGRASCAAPGARCGGSRAVDRPQRRGRCQDPGHPRTEFTPFDSWDEIEGIAAELGSFGPLVIFAVGTGVRPEEAFGAAWTDVDLEDGIRCVRRAYAKGRLKTCTKTDRSRRRVRSRAKVIAALGELPRHHGVLFPNTAGGRIDINNLALARVGADAEGRGRGAAADLRHAAHVRDDEPCRRDEHLHALSPHGHERSGLGAPPYPAQAAPRRPHDGHLESIV